MTHEPDQQLEAQASVSRLRLLLQLGRFQFKLLLDGVRDLVLSPIAFGAVIVGILSPGDQPDRLFRRLLIWGRKTEDWINLFGYRSRAGADDLLDPIEQAVLDEASTDGPLGRANQAFNDGLAKRSASAHKEPVETPNSGESKR